ncbi:uncharacterized protein LY89DRAFT_461994 [Mollisia scopiformis]|uniref:Uncharacterized protein n=1 Tax=Mollisia scopiformis TaxID=149040 RepID=A0A194XI66_MOLSC|nr:uncharacterized protein LY89DRAFT_461994 [Mollisia scopiformis]KUJ19819.1 hypothetical protein LY89DRAFT_461994 [Mollisia scopiformis]
MPILMPDRRSRDLLASIAFQRYSVVGVFSLLVPVVGRVVRKSFLSGAKEVLSF